MREGQKHRCGVRASEPWTSMMVPDPFENPVASLTLMRTEASTIFLVRLSLGPLARVFVTGLSAFAIPSHRVCLILTNTRTYMVFIAKS